MTKYIGKKIADRYFTTEQLGVGGMGVVLAASQFEDPSQKVAIKIIERGGELTFEDRLRFQKEASLMSQLYHPNIINFTEFGIQEKLDSLGKDQFYIVMELVKGKTLKDFLAERENLQLNFFDFLQVSTQLAGALDYIHSKDIIHRDIKPQNIMVCENQEFGNIGFQVKILDFGVARMGEARLFTGKYQGGGIDEFAGTPLYMAPEQTPHLDAPADHRLDLYSLGCVLYECLCGKAPFTGRNREEVAIAHASSPLEPIRKYRPDIPDFLADLVENLLHKNPDDRYSSAFSFLADCYQAKRILDSSNKMPPLPIGTRNSILSISARLPLAGNPQGLADLIDFYEQIETGSARGRMTVITSEPGYGKSRLLSEVRDYLRHKKVRFISGSFCQYEANLRLNAIANAYNEYLLRVIKSSPLEASRIRDGFKSILGPLAHHVTNFIPGMAPYIEGIPALQVDSDESNQNLSNLSLDPKAFIDFNRSIFDDDQPVVFIFDDLHWADDQSLELIDQLFTYSNSHRAYMILSFQTGDFSNHERIYPLIQKFQRLKRRFQHVELAPLNKSACAELAKSLLGMGYTLRDDLADYIYEKSAGIPLKVIQITRDLILQNSIQIFKQNQWYLADSKQNIKLASFPSIDLILGNLKSWDLHQKVVLQSASCIGIGFSFDTLKNIIDLPEISLVRALQQSLKQGLVELDHSQIQSIQQYRFVHQKVRDAVYRTISEKSLIGLHLRLGRHFHKILPTHPAPSQTYAVTNQFNQALAKIENVDGSDQDNLGEKLDLETSSFFLTEVSSEDYLVSVKINQLAAKEALKSHAYQAAERYLETGLILAEKIVPKIRSTQEIKNIQSMRAISAFMARDFNQARITLEFLKDTLPDDLVYLRYLELVAYCGYVSESQKLIDELIPKYFKNRSETTVINKSGISGMTFFANLLGKKEEESKAEKLFMRLSNLKQQHESADFWSDLKIADLFHWGFICYSRQSFEKARAHNEMGLEYLLSKPRINLPRAYISLADFSLIAFSTGKKRFARKILRRLLKGVSGVHSNVAIYLYLIHYGMDHIYTQSEKILKRSELFQVNQGASLRVGLWQQLLKLRVAYGFFQIAHHEKVNHYAMDILRSIPTRSWVSPKATAMLMFSFLLRGERDAAIKLGQSFSNRRHQVSSRKDEIFPLIIRSLLEFGRGDFDGVEFSLVSLGNAIQSGSDSEFLYSFEEDFLVLFSALFWVLVASETGAQNLLELLKPIRKKIAERSIFHSKSNPVAAAFCSALEEADQSGYEKCHDALNDFALKAEKQGLHLWSLAASIWAYDCFAMSKQSTPSTRSKYSLIDKLNIEPTTTKMNQNVRIRYNGKLLSMRKWMASQRLFGLLRITEDKVSSSGRQFTRYFMPTIGSEFTSIYQGLPTTLALDFLMEVSISDKSRDPEKLFEFSFELIEKHYGADNIYVMKSSENGPSKVLKSFHQLSKEQKVEETLEPYLGTSLHPLFLPLSIAGNNDKASGVSGTTSSSQDVAVVTQVQQNQSADQSSTILENHLDTTQAIDPESFATQVMDSGANGQQDHSHVPKTSQFSTGTLGYSGGSGGTLSGILPMSVTQNQSVYLFIERIGAIFDRTPDESRLELKLFVVLLARAVSLSLTFSANKLLKPWINDFYHPGTYDLQDCPWLYLQMEGRLRKDRESIWFLGRNLPSNRYLLHYCHIEGPKLVREQLSRLVWHHLQTLIDLENSEINSGSPIISEDRLKNDISVLCRHVSGFESLEKISIVFSLMDRNESEVVSGQIGPYRPIAFGSQYRVEPSNDAILRLRGGGLLRYWKVVTEFNGMSPLFVGADTKRLSREKSSRLREEILNAIGRRKSGENGLQELPKILKERLEGFNPRCYVAVLPREAYDDLPQAN